MRIVVASLSVCFFLVGCASDIAKEAPAPVPPGNQPQAQTPVKPKQMARSSPAIPKDAQWTILCRAITGPDHVQQAKTLKERLIQSTPLKDWHLLHQDGQTLLYYGYYRTFNDEKSDPKESARAQRHRKQIDGLTDDRGNRPFRHSIFVAISSPDPTAPDEWNLAKATGYWSLQIAAYKDSPLRKQYAVDAVKAARAQGIEAYFYHGETTSSVCIGAWPMEAIVPQDQASAGNPNVDEPVLVLPPEFPVPDQPIHDAQGQRLRPIAQRIIPRDPTLEEAIKRYPTHAINGQVMVKQQRDPVTNQPRTIPDESFLVIIPQAEESAIGAAPAPPPALIDPALVDTGTGPAPSSGRLRSFTE